MKQVHTSSKRMSYRRGADQVQVDLLQYLLRIVLGWHGSRGGTGEEIYLNYPVQYH